jgi:hypothetical protein
LLQQFSQASKARIGRKAFVPLLLDQTLDQPGRVLGTVDGKRQLVYFKNKNGYSRLLNPKVG